jgi:general secretion pathway protein D
VWLLAVVAGSFLTVSAQTPAETPANRPTPPVIAGPAAPEETVLPLKLRDAPLELILDLLETWTGRTILRPQALPTPTFTLTTKEPLPKSEALRALETLLNLNQIGLVRMGDKFLKVIPLQNVRMESPQIIEGSSLDLPPSGQVVTKLFQFQFLRVNEFLPQIASLLNQNVSQPVLFEKNNAALLTDSITTIQRIELLVQKLDQPLVSNLTPKFYSIHFAKASDVVTKLRAMFQGQLANQLGSSTSYSADDRTNQVILIADPRQLVFFDELLAKLDVKSDPNTRTEVIYLKHATAKDVASLLSTLVSGQTKATQNSGSIAPGQVVQPGQTPQPNSAPQPPPQIAAAAAALGELGSTQFSSLVTVIADDRSNAVVVNGTVDDLRLIKDLVDKIDIVLAQVCIEIVIAEVTLEDNATSGIDSLGLDVVGNKLVGITGTIMGAKNTTALSLKGSTKSAGYVTNINGTNVTPESGYAATTGHSSLIGLINLSSTPRKNNATVLSVPTITTTHNKEAKLIIGSTRPVISSSTSANASSGSTPGYNTSSITQQDIGTTLTVKPLIGNDGSVQLDIKQLFTDSDPANDVTIDGNAQPIINKREADSFVTVKSGEIIVLGGIQKQNVGHSTYRLGPIPWIGDLLGKRNRTNQRTELVIFIRPTVLTNTPADNEEALKRINGMPNKDEIRQKLDPNYVPPKTPFYKKHIPIP